MLLDFDNLFAKHRAKLTLASQKFSPYIARKFINEYTYILITSHAWEIIKHEDIRVNTVTCPVGLAPARCKLGGYLLSFGRNAMLTHEIKIYFSPMHLAQLVQQLLVLADVAEAAMQQHA